MKRIIFSPREVKYLSEHEYSLRILAFYHEVEATKADGSDAPASAQRHEERVLELVTAADELERLHNLGEAPTFDDEPVTMGLVRAHDALKRLIFSADQYLKLRGQGAWTQSQAEDLRAARQNLEMHLKFARTAASALPVLTPPGEPDEIH